MRLPSVAIAATALALLTAPSFAMEKMDGDAILKMIFHGKPGEWASMMMPMGGMSPMTMMAPKVPMKPHMMKPMGKSMMAPAKSY